MRFPDEVLGVGVLGEHLWAHRQAATPAPTCPGTPSLTPCILPCPATHLPGGGLAPEELMVEGAVGWAEAGLQEDAAVGNGLQWGGTLIGKAEPYEEL